MPELNLFSDTFNNANILSVVVGTNCPRGGDAGHGGRTVFSLIDQTSTDMHLSVNNGKYERVQCFELLLGGDTECETFIEALTFALQTLRVQSGIGCDTSNRP